jgi:Na+-translocating ferredoxin:NAD+ oxidoreductase RnfG subunit
VIGKHLAIDYALALSPAGEVRQLEILTYRESYGGEIRSADWRKQFEGKTSRSPLALNDDIRNISGATLSSRHVTEGVKRVLATYDICVR